MQRRFSVLALAFLLAATGVLRLQATAAPITNPSFNRTWERTDKPVADGQASRTWMWGAEAYSGALIEAYAEAPGGTRTVQYFDKSRMEITDPTADPSADWYVTNGLLVVELMTGNMQVGANQFDPRSPADVNVAGDADDSSGPTYASFGVVREAPAAANGAAIIQRLSRAGTITDDASLSARGVTAAYRVTVPGIDHQIASPFWSFMTSSGTVYDNGAYVMAALFPNPFYATGLPVSEAYWSTVKVAGTYQDVLIQCFERRCLTYTPNNPAGWQVEAGNVGQHYYTWRYGDVAPPSPSPSPGPDATTFGDGIWMVGEDIPAGTYRNADSSGGCYWARLNGFGGSLNEIIANQFTYARQIVTILPGDAGFESVGCGVWSSNLAPITSSTTAPFGDGTYLVGVDIAPGTWRNDDSSGGCYWARLNGFSGTLDEIEANAFTYDPQIVTISSGDEGFFTEGCGTWTKVNG